MRAVLISEPKEVELVELELAALRADEVLVRTHTVALSSAELALYQGRRPEGFYRYPVVPGSIWSGTVELMGEQVTRMKVGDRVVAESLVYCGLCRNCRAGQTQLCESGYDEIGFTRHGALAEYVVAPARLLHILPADADLDEVTLLAPTANVAQAFLRTQPRPGAVIVILGSDALSLLALQVARLYSPSALIFMAFREERLQQAHMLGATHTIKPGREELGEVVNDLTQGRGADLVFEGTGHPEAIASALQLVRRGGTVLLEGLTGMGTFLSVESDLLAVRQLSIFGIFGASTEAWSYALQLYQAGQLELGSLISHSFPLDDYQEALDLLLYQNPGVSQVVIHP